MKHIMVDLETFGTKPYSTILSIGATYFDPTKQGREALKSNFYVTIDPIASAKAGFRSDMNTICWWMLPAQRAAWDEWMSVAHFEPQAALFGFGQWLGSLFDLSQDPHAHDDVKVGDRQTFETADHVAIWGNGATFDNTLLRQAYELLGMEVPWKHWNDKCFRTLKNSAMFTGPKHEDPLNQRPITAKSLVPPFEGTKHNALADAQHQALWLCNIAQTFNLVL